MTGRRGLLIVATLAACATGAREGATRIEAWEVVEEQRFGEEDGAGSLADIRGVAADDSGRVLTLDFKDQQVHVFDSMGRYVRSLGRSGQGPGEFGNANGLLRAPDGRLWINDPSNNRFTVLGPDGSLLATHPIQIRGYGYLWQAWFDTAGTLFEMISVRVDTTFRRRVQRFRMDAAVLASDTLLQYPCDSLARATPLPANYYRTPRGYMQVPFRSSPLQAVDPAGGVWCTSGERFEIYRVSLEDHFTGVVARGTRAPVVVTATERDSAAEAVRKFFEQTDGTNPDLSRIPQEKPPLRSLRVDPAGRLWVQVNVSDSGSTWDVFDATGHQVATAHSAFGVLPYHPLLFQGDRMYAVASDRDVPTIVRARIIRGRLAGAGRDR